mmetsp:Transcript_47214/g.133142  ORF Transcript_47214/g.133142 Transcript_47214/m.133142 type:complete len:236 (-) Transcript_47214:106-813(-)
MTSAPRRGDLVGAPPGSLRVTHYALPRMDAKSSSPHQHVRALTEAPHGLDVAEGGSGGESPDSSTTAAIVKLPVLFSEGMRRNIGPSLVGSPQGLRGAIGGSGCAVAAGGRPSSAQAASLPRLLTEGSMHAPPRLPPPSKAPAEGTPARDGSSPTSSLSSSSAVGSASPRAHRRPPHPAWRCPSRSPRLRGFQAGRQGAARGAVSAGLRSDWRTLACSCSKISRESMPLIAESSS